MLKNHFYTGVIPWRGKIYPGKHPVIIPQQLFDAVQEAFASHNRHSYGRYHVWYGSGLITCGHCEHAVTVEAIRKKDRYCHYARCSKISRPDHPNHRLPGRQVEAQLFGIVQAIELPRNMCDWLRDMADRECANKAEWHRQQEQTLRQQVTKLKSRLEAAYIDKLDGKLAGDRHKELEGRWRVELNQVERCIAEHASQTESPLRRGVKVLELTQDLGAAFLANRPRFSPDAASLGLGRGPAPNPLPSAS